MAIVAVGDFDEAEIEALIREHFSGLDRWTGRSAPARRVPGSRSRRNAVQRGHRPRGHVDQRSGGLQAAACRDADRGRHATVLVDGLYHGMMIARLGELSQKPDPPYQYAFAASGRLGRTKSMYRLFAVGARRRRRAWAGDVADRGQARREHGFTESELVAGEDGSDATDRAAVRRTRQAGVESTCRVLRA